MYHLKTSQIIDSKLINKDYESWDFTIREINCPENTCVALLETDLLINENKLGKIKGKLNDIIQSTDVSDNPILMKIEFFPSDRSK